MNRRSRHVRILPDGSLWVEETFLALLASWDKRAPKRAERLSRKAFARDMTARGYVIVRREAIREVAA